MAARDPLEEEFREFVAARSGALLRTAYLLAGDWATAEDLLQTALTKTYLAWKRLGGIEAIEPYARRVLVNTSTSWWRRRWHGERPTEVLPERAGVDEIEQQLDRDLLWRHLSALPARQRAVLVLRFYEDLSEAQTAALLEISPGTVKSQTFRALGTLRRRLGSAAALGLPAEPEPTPASGTPTRRRPARTTTAPAAPATGTPAAGATRAGASAGGTPATGAIRPGTPAGGTPVTGATTAGTPATGMPAVPVATGAPTTAAIAASGTAPAARPAAFAGVRPLPIVRPRVRGRRPDEPPRQPTSRSQRPFTVTEDEPVRADGPVGEDELARPCAPPSPTGSPRPARSPSTRPEWRSGGPGASVADAP
ncbi:SigE family RNA polymerase sigma factor [Micromonospora sp. R77]|uniref:SigE family RNA polymerase sigma factor n=1 Tax=Micromonospora sp. R77 TaxID=2925836 RepID=UPI001F604BF0|nr:SigE family RNA polymerase sigma factor [Micromonospora sp. R77]MCI4064134.1 SigE family RNA polymerase sigma factor [Micromonospora sp. R77]